MNRVQRLKALYVGAVLALLGLAALLILTVFRGHEALGTVLIAVALLVPGRIQGLFFRHLYRGRRLLDSGRSNALVCLHAFFEQLKERLWQKRLMWLAWSFYTVDVEAMTWNAIGAAHTELGNWGDAKTAFAKAMAADEKYPIPHWNLAKIAIAEGDGAEAERELRCAATLGYRVTSVDRLIHQAQRTLARVEGRSRRRNRMDA